jgi:hypothetical protein
VLSVRRPKLRYEGLAPPGGSGTKRLSFWNWSKGKQGERSPYVGRSSTGATHRGLKKKWGKGGKDGSFSVRLQSEGTTYHLISAWTYGHVEVQFETLKYKPPFDDKEKRLALKA